MSKKTDAKKGPYVAMLPEVVRQVQVVGGIFLEEAVAEVGFQFGRNYSANYKPTLTGLFQITKPQDGGPRVPVVQSRTSWDHAIKRLRNAIRKGENAELVLALEAQINTDPLNTSRFIIKTDPDANYVPVDLAYQIQTESLTLFDGIPDDERNSALRRVKRIDPEYRLGYRVEVGLLFEVTRETGKKVEVMGQSTSSFLEAIALTKWRLTNSRKRKK
jgi:hypothetical protein